MKEKNPNNNPVVIHYKKIDDKGFANYAVELYRAKGVPASTMKTLMIVCELAVMHWRRLDAEARRILSKYAVIDEATKLPKNFPKGPFIFADSDGEAKHDAEMVELWATKIPLPYQKTPIAHVENAGLSGATLRALDFIFSGLEPQPVLEQETIPAKAGDGDGGGSLAAPAAPTPGPA